MSDKSSVRAAIFIFGIPTLITSAMGIFVWNASARAEHATFETAADTGSAAAVIRPAGETAHEGIGAPSRIRIPSIGVNASVEAVTVDSEGYMDTPKRPKDVAWYEPGPRPGEAGSAVIAGHIDWYDGKKAVFAKLNRLKPGDVIAVSDGAGGEHSFVVRKKRQYDASDDATDVFVSTDGEVRLNLVTCSGSWKKKTGQYSRRLVIFAVKKK